MIPSHLLPSELMEQLGKGEVANEMTDHVTTSGKYIGHYTL